MAKYTYLPTYLSTKAAATLFFLIYCKNISNFLFWVLWICLATFIKNDNANFCCLPACKKWTPSLTSFLRYCKDIYYRLVTLSTLRMFDHVYQQWQCHPAKNFETQSIEINLQDTCILICTQKINFISNLTL